MEQIVSVVRPGWRLRRSAGCAWKSCLIRSRYTGTLRAASLMRSRRTIRWPPDTPDPAGRPHGSIPDPGGICNQERISWRDVHTFDMDEYCDWQGRAVPITHPLSFEVPAPVAVRRPRPGVAHPGGAGSLPRPARSGTHRWAHPRVGGIDTCYGGIGYHGHVAFNEPPISRWYKVTCRGVRNSLTRIVPLGRRRWC